MKLKLLYIFLVSIFLSVAAFAQPDPAATPPVLSKGYVLGPGDEITVKVLGEQDYDFTTVVDENGRIEVPFHENPVAARCKSEREIKGDILRLLEKYLKNPQLSVRVVQKSRPPATVYGEVRTPQQLELKRKVTLVEVLAFSGGVLEEAGGMVQVIRTQPPLCADLEADWKPDPLDETGTRLKMYSLANLNGGTDEVNPVIYPGDIVVVLKALPVYITGEVLQPQGIYLKEGGTTLTEAIGKIGGVKREAKTKDIKIYRQKVGSKDREVISANFDLIKKGLQKDPLLVPYDIIEVDKAKESLAKSILNVALGAGKAVLTSGSTNLGYKVIY